MDRRTLAVLVLALAVAFGGCGSGTDLEGIIAGQALRTCTNVSILNLLRVVGVFDAVVSVAQGDPAPPGFFVDFNPSSDTGDPPNTFDYAVAFDTNGNGTDDTRISGKATFSEDPTDGLNVGATIAFTMLIEAGSFAGNGDAGTMTGDGSVTVTIEAANRISLVGTVNINDTVADESCGSQLTFPAATPLRITLPESIIVAPQLALEVLSIELFGTIQAIIQVLADRLDADIVLTQGSQVAQVSGEINGVASGFDLTVFPPTDVVNALTSCLQDQFDQTGELVDVFGSIADEIAALADIGDINTITGLTATMTGLGVFDYTIDLGERVGTPGTITGQIFVTLTRISFSWSLSVPTVTGSDFLPGTTGNSTVPFDIALDTGGNPVSLTGAGVLTVNGCQAEFGTLTPVSLAEPFAGTVAFKVTVGLDILDIVVDFGLNQFSLTINGIPVPPELIDFQLD